MQTAKLVPALSTITALLALVSAACSSDGAALDSNPETSSEAVVSAPAGLAAVRFAGGLTNPTAMQFASDGRLFVCEQGGALRVIAAGALLTAPFLKLTVDSTNERGLLGVAFDPDFASNAFVYVYYTTKAPKAHNRVSRFTAQGDVAVPGSEKVLLDLDDLSAATNHNGGAIHFGPDGKLYVAVGENANGANAQTLGNLLGKVLRVSSDGTIPQDNPFFTSATGKNRAIWALGLRNPFSFAFQPGTDRMFINDVGQDKWEEIDQGVAGANYGWPNVEGNANTASFKNPVAQYGHGQSLTTGCAISGGTFYNPATSLLPTAFVGKYLFADACGGWIRQLNPTTHTVTAFASGLPFPVDLTVGDDGAVYALTRGDSSVWRIGGTGAATAPVIDSQPDHMTVSPGKTATFHVDASGAAPLTFTWFRNDVQVAGATSSTLTLHNVQQADDGAHIYGVVSNGSGTLASATVTLHVQAVHAVVSLQHDVRPIFESRCSGCHSGGSAGGLSLRVGQTHASLLAASTCNHSVKRVVPGSPHRSLLWQKLAGMATCGGPMPAGTPGLKTIAPHEFDTIEAWIAQGAKDN